ncbi:ArsR/SmtB family transcription factor [Streptomyces albipurpureus]|uniref:Helix-turn-helix domain-containing protein n=1 Tax=Streptomyces albipurpureus TaxID=2897419 RepID=A0ABT0UQA4_9ACTN|nr:helix-turn-helix domain-containing protein [Streptomyces sp. CWNU-1]MCM2390542.1 helix-turn-helix domain-containing protein [Streptomyces sp. CWNU-1]
MGHGRATVLSVIAESRGGVSTGDLADRAGLSAATVSEHTSVLRRAGLVSTRQLGRARCHSLTTLGRDLLQSAATDVFDGRYRG